eukprot:PhF_6_TR22228/c0_g1_i1/m.31393
MLFSSVVSFLLFVFLTSSTTDAQLPQNQITALRMFYIMCHGEQWPLTSPWSEDTDTCTWQGLTCSDTTNSKSNQTYTTVTKIQIPKFGNVMRCEVPLILQNLKDIVTFDLGESGVIGTFPTAFKSWTGLQNLRLPLNELTGTLPQWLGTSFLELNELVLSARHPRYGLSGTLPPSLVELKSLRVLALDGNQFSGALPLLPYNLMNVATVDGSVFSSPCPPPQSVLMLPNIHVLCDVGGKTPSPQKNNNSSSGTADSNDSVSVGNVLIYIWAVIAAISLVLIVTYKAFMKMIEVRNENKSSSSSSSSKRSTEEMQSKKREFPLSPGTATHLHEVSARQGLPQTPVYGGDFHNEELQALHDV